MTTPTGRRELFLDAQEQTEDWNRAQREEERDGAVDWDPRDDANYPDARDLADLAYWDRRAERRVAGR